jgi:hypothetical protein
MTCVNILREYCPCPIASKELFKVAYDKKEQIKSYLGDVEKLSSYSPLLLVCLSWSATVTFDLQCIRDEAMNNVKDYTTLTVLTFFNRVMYGHDPWNTI